MTTTLSLIGLARVAAACADATDRTESFAALLPRSDLREANPR